LSRFVIFLLVLSLTENLFPALNIIALSGLLLLYLAHANVTTDDPDVTPRTARKFTIYAYVYWITSYLLTGAPIANFFSYDFLRFDGALLIAYLPLLFLVNYSLNENYIRKVVDVFLGVLSAVAVLGAAEFANTLGVPLGLSTLPEELQLVHFAPSPPQFIVHGLFRAHNAAGAAYALASCIALALVLHERKTNLFSVRTLCFAAVFTGLVLSKSRTAYTAFLPVSIFIFGSARKDLKKALRIILLVIVPLSVFLLVQPEVSQRVQGITDTEDPNVFNRFIVFKEAIDDFYMSPLVGIGFGRHNDQSLVFSGIPNIAYIATGGDIVNDDEHAHNSYLHFLAEGGLIGLALMMGIWVGVYRWVKKARLRFAEFTFGKAFTVGVQGCVILQLLISFTEHSLGTGVSVLCTLTMVGLLHNLVASQYCLHGSLGACLQPAV
jgi:O-antigen ligase